MRVWGLEFRVYVLGSKVWGFGFRVLGFGFRVQGLAFRRELGEIAEVKGQDLAQILTTDNLRTLKTLGDTRLWVGPRIEHLLTSRDLPGVDHS